MEPLKGKHAVVCGSSQGIGKAAALELAASGASITLIARSEDALEQVIYDLPKAHSDQVHSYVVADFSKPDELKERIKDVKQPVHILVNNSGGPAPGPVYGADLEAFEEGFRKHVLCNQILAQAFVEGMKKEKYGRIINIISTSVKEPIQGLGVSNTIRAAVANWAKTLSKELGPFGITVNNVLPGFTDTARLKSLFENKAKKLNTSVDQVYEDSKKTIPLGRLAEPAEIAYAIAFLASPKAAYISGVNLPVDGGRLNCG